MRESNGWGGEGQEPDALPKSPNSAQRSTFGEHTARLPSAREARQIPQQRFGSMPAKFGGRQHLRLAPRLRELV